MYFVISSQLNSAVLVHRQKACFSGASEFPRCVFIDEYIQVSAVINNRGHLRSARACAVGIVNVNGHIPSYSDHQWMDLELCSCTHWNDYLSIRVWSGIQIMKGNNLTRLDVKNMLS